MATENTYKPESMTEEEYRSICHRLGFLTDVHFVAIEDDHSISWTAGKPDEIRSLAAACRREAMPMSEGLQHAIASRV